MHPKQKKGVKFAFNYKNSAKNKKTRQMAGQSKRQRYTFASSNRWGAMVCGSSAKVAKINSYNYYKYISIKVYRKYLCHLCQVVKNIDISMV